MARMHEIDYKIYGGDRERGPSAQIYEHIDESAYGLPRSMTASASISIRAPSRMS